MPFFKCLKSGRVIEVSESHAQQVMRRHDTYIEVQKVEAPKPIIEAPPPKKGRSK